MDAGLRGVTLRFSHEVREAEVIFGQIPQMKLPPEMMKLAQHIIRAKVRGIRSIDVRRSLPARASRHPAQEADESPAQAAAIKPSQENVVNLMDALRRSIAARLQSRRRSAAVQSHRHAVLHGRAGQDKCFQL